MRQQLLEAGEVPGRLRGLGREVGVGEPVERCAERDREPEHDGRGAERDHDVTHEQVRPREDRVVDRPLGFGDRLAVDDTEQPNPPAVEVRRGLRHRRGRGGRRRFGTRGRLLGERAHARRARPRSRPCVLARCARSASARGASGARPRAARRSAAACSGRPGDRRSGDPGAGRRRTGRSARARCRPSPPSTTAGPKAAGSR